MRRGDENFRHLFGIGVHRRRHRQHHAGNRVRQRPVDKLFGNERLVRHDNLFSVPVADGGRTGINAGDAARQVANGDRIADADRLLKQDNQAGDKVGEDLLQAKPETHTQRGDQPLQLRPLDTDHREAHQPADQHQQILSDGGDGVAGAGG